MRRGARRLVASFASLAAACGLTADFSGIQGGSPPTPPADAGTFVDGSADAGGSVDAADTAPARPFCASLAPAPRFCADFDEGGQVSAGWTLVDATVGSTVALGGVAFSPPSAFLSAVDPSTTRSSARLQEALPLAATHAHVETRMLVAATPGDYELVVLHEDTAQGVTFGIFYRLVDGALVADLRTLDADGGVTTRLYPLGPPPASWRNVVIDVDLRPAGHLTIQHDGVTVVDEAVPTSTPSRTKLFVDVGIYSGPRASMQASFDDVIIDWR